MFSTEQFVSISKKKYSSEGKIIVLSFPTAVGKDAVLKAMPVEVKGTPVRTIKSLSTKIPRQCELESQDYSSATMENFIQMIENNEFLEFTSYIRAQNGIVYFGTPLKDFTDKKEILLWKVSPDRLVEIILLLQSTNDSFKSSVIPIYIGINSLLTLYIRAKRRAQSQEEWKDRLKLNFISRLKQEFSFWKCNKEILHPYVITNDLIPQHCANTILNKLSK